MSTEEDRRNATVIEMLADLPSPDGPEVKPGFLPATATLSRALIDAHLTPAIRRQLAGGTCCAIIEVPGAGWVDPIRRALRRLGEWDHAVVRTGSERSSSRPDGGNDVVVETLARGGRVVGISHAPDRLLPSALVGAADVRLVIGTPSNPVIARVIRAATGRSPRALPDNLVAGLGFEDLCAAIRVGSTPASCVRRIKAATAARTGTDASLADVPLLTELHGYGEAMGWALDLVADLERWRRGEIAFDAIERCAVFASEPGLGKTTFCRSLAKTARLPIFVTSVADWFASSTGYLDGVIKQIDAIFSNAAAVAPAIVFLDEIDAVPNRAKMTDRAREWWTPMVTRLLTILDGAASGMAGRLIVIGATNHAENLDPGLIRPGRLSRVIHIGKPSPEDLAGILRQHLGADLSGTDLTEVARLGDGATGADAVGWIRSARRAARQAGRDMVLADLMAEVAPEIPRSPEDDLRIALHESGHAVTAHALGWEVQLVTLAVGAGGGARTVASAPGKHVFTRLQLEDQILVTLAGRAAEEVMCGTVSTASGGDNSDLALAANLLAAIHATYGLGTTLLHRASAEDAHALVQRDGKLQREVTDDLQRLYAQALGLVRDRRGQISSVAAALLRSRTLTAQAFGEALCSPPVALITSQAEGTHKQPDGPGRHCVPEGSARAPSDGQDRPGSPGPESKINHPGQETDHVKVHSAGCVVLPRSPFGQPRFLEPPDRGRLGFLLATSPGRGMLRTRSLGAGRGPAGGFEM